MANDQNADNNDPGLTSAELAEFKELGDAGVQEVAIGDRRIRMASMSDIRKSNDAQKERKRGSRTHRSVFSKSVHRGD